MLSRLTYAKITDIASKPYMEWINTYNDAGNMTDYIYDEGSGDVSTTYSFDGDLVTGDSTGKVVNWDDNGRQTCRLTTIPAAFTLIYDWEGRLRQGKYGPSNSIIEAKYTPDGIRTTKKNLLSYTFYNHKYIVDVSGTVPTVLLILDANNNNAILKTYIHANGQVLAQHNGDHTAARYFYLHDRLGSVREVIDQEGTVVNHYTYDPWGRPVTGESYEPLSNLYRFANYVYDSEILQYHCYRRQYDPVLGRFTSRDPVQGTYEEPMTLHRYLYCINNPINMTDPTGEMGYGGVLDRVEDLTDSISGYYTALDAGLQAAGGSWEGILDVAITVNNSRETYFAPENLGKSQPIGADIGEFFSDLAGACNWGRLALCMAANSTANPATTAMFIATCTRAVTVKDSFSIKSCVVFGASWGLTVALPCIEKNCKNPW